MTTLSRRIEACTLRGLPSDACQKMLPLGLSVLTIVEAAQKEIFIDGAVVLQRRHVGNPGDDFVHGDFLIQHTRELFLRSGGRAPLEKVDGRSPGQVARQSGGGVRRNGRIAGQEMKSRAFDGAERPNIGEGLFQGLGD
jgi:hypothetical protein